MQLNQVQSLNDFENFYKDNNLSTTQEKIDFLVREMGVLLIRHDEPFDQEEELTTLQIHALRGWDGQSHNQLVG